MSQSYFEITYRGPWIGQDNSQPENMIAPTSTPFAINNMLKNSELRTRPQLYPTIPGVPDGSVINTISTFLDSTDTMRTVAWSSDGLWLLSSNSNVWSAIGTFLGQIFTMPWANISFLRKLFFTNENALGKISSWDGIAGAYVQASNFCSGRFLMELANHLIVGYTWEAGAPHSQRVRWSASGNPNQFDPSIDITAGFVDLLDVSDSITGLMSVGRIGFIFRNNGITVMTPTGVGSNPFTFNHLWSSQKGVGQVLPATTASYGSIGVFISTDDVYSVTATTFNNIGSGVIDAINNDIFLYSNIPTVLGVGITKGGIQASITPKYADNLIYLQYNLIIPTGTGTIIWKYSFKDNSWVKEILNSSIATAPPIYVPQAT